MFDINKFEENYREAIKKLGNAKRLVKTLQPIIDTADYSNDDPLSIVNYNISFNVVDIKGLIAKMIAVRELLKAFNIKMKRAQREPLICNTYSKCIFINWFYVALGISIVFYIKTTIDDMPKGILKEGCHFQEHIETSYDIVCEVNK